MSEPVPSCPRCAELLERIAQLEQQVRDLEARLGQNASNSSLPPSANPPSAPKPVVKKRTGKRAGGQPGHPGQSRLRLPPGRLQHPIAPAPSQWERCQAPLPAQRGPPEPDPSCHQLAAPPRPAA